MVVTGKKAHADDTSAETRPLRQSDLTIFAVAAGLGAANMYYAQPILGSIGSALHIPASLVGIVVTLSQLGNALGLLFVVPAGDLVNRRLLIRGLLVSCTIALVVAASATTAIQLYCGLLVAGLSSVFIMVLVPLAGQLVPEDSRGSATGTVMSGVLIGILASRLLSGALTQWLGWRAAYIVAAVAITVVGAVLLRILRQVGADTRTIRAGTLSYWQILRSVGVLIVSARALRRRMVLGVMGFFTFSLLWTSLTFLLSGPPYELRGTAIGAFGLAGLVGAASAQKAGKFADRGWTGYVTIGSWALIGAGWLVLWSADLTDSSIGLVMLVVGIAVLDAGMQGQHITNQSVLYKTFPESASRVTTAYMTANLASGALGAAVAGVLWKAGGWGAVSVAGLASVVVGLGVGVWDLLRDSKTPRPIQR
ncbi:MFS transporter [Nocardia terrae]|uniref:MFS transporter n=1 Tax=Nocardia terrae TaxID=2675851 RepID=UPI002E267248